MDMNFGIRLKELRVNKGLTLRQVSIKSGLNYSYISLLENGKRNIKRSHSDTIIKLAKGLNTSPATIFKLAGMKMPSQESLKHPEDYTNGHFDIAKAIKNKHYMTWQGKPLTDLDKQMLIKMFGGGDSKHE